MAIRYYDDAITEKLKKWTPTNSTLRVLKPDETRRYFETQADDKNDKPLTLPCIALSRSNDLELLLSIKNPRSYDGLKIVQDDEGTTQLNVIPVKVQYQLDIYTKKYEEADEYLRQYLFKLVNNPRITVEIPYNGVNFTHIAYLRVLNTISDTSNISEHLFPGQFTRFTIQMELLDGFFFSIPYTNNWNFIWEDDEEYDPKYGQLEVVDNLVKPTEIVDSGNMPYGVKKRKHS